MCEEFNSEAKKKCHESVEAQTIYSYIKCNGIAAMVLFMFLFLRIPLSRSFLQFFTTVRIYLNVCECGTHTQQCEARSQQNRSKGTAKISCCVCRCICKRMPFVLGHALLHTHLRTRKQIPLRTHFDFDGFVLHIIVYGCVAPCVHIHTNCCENTRKLVQQIGFCMERIARLCEAFV